MLAHDGERTEGLVQSSCETIGIESTAMRLSPKLGACGRKIFTQLCVSSFHSGVYL